MAGSRMKVAVVGVGTIGAMALLHLARSGVEAVGYDAFTPGHDRGAAGGESRIFRVAYEEQADYVPLLLESLGRWRSLQAEAGQQLLYPVGCATVGPSDDPALQSVRDAAAAHGLILEELDETAARIRVPEHPLRPGESLLFDPLGGLIRPEASVVTAVGLAQAAGAQVRANTAVLDVQEDGDRAVVVTEHGTDTFDRVIVCPGPWANRLKLFAGFQLAPKQFVATWFPRRDPRAFDLNRTPVAIRVGTPTFSCFPSVDGVSVKVIARGPAFTDLNDPDDLPRTVGRDIVEHAASAVRAVLPGLHDTPIRVATYSDLYSPDEHALLGPLHPDSPVTLATAFSGHGFKLAPVFGEIAAELAVDGHTKHDISFLSPDRFQAAQQA
nr:N-methyl-L-tryptophan oxidase [Streptomyces sp. NBC_00886]